MQQSLLSGWEVTRFSPVTKDYPQSTICEQIKHKESFYAKKCLGADLYNAMLTDMISYPGINEYKMGFAYNEDDLVNLNGTIFKSLFNGNVTSPYIDETRWVRTKKFNIQKFNDLWYDGYLVTYLSYMIVYSSITYVTNPAGATGVITYWATEFGVTHVPEPTLYNYKANLYDDAQDILTNVIDFLGNGQFNEYSLSICGKGCRKTRKTRIYYRV